MLRNPPLLDVTLAVCASLFFVLYVFAMCVYLLSFCVSAFFSFFFLFIVLCVPLSIYREIPKKLFLILLSTDQIME